MIGIKHSKMGFIFDQMVYIITQTLNVIEECKDSRKTKHSIVQWMEGTNIKLAFAGSGLYGVTWLLIILAHHLMTNLL